MFHLRMSDKVILDLGGLDVLPSAYDQLILPSDQYEISFFIPLTKISQRQPSVGGPRVRGGFRVAVVARQATGAPALKLSRFSLCRYPACFIDKTHFSVNPGSPDGEVAHFRRILRRGENHAAPINGAVGVEHDAAEFFLGLPRQIRTQ